MILKNKYVKIFCTLTALVIFINFISVNVLAVSSSELSFSVEGFDFLMGAEDFSPTCYKDGEHMSIGYGTTCGTGLHTVGLHSITREQAKIDMTDYVNNVASPNVRNSTVGLDMTQNQFDALISLVYTTGNPASVSKSPLVAFLKGELSENEARRQYSEWYIKGYDENDNLVVLPGLINRRKKEADLFFKDCPASPEISISGESVPGTMYQGNTFTIAGTITSGLPMTYLDVSCYDITGKRIIGCETDANGSTSYSIANLQNSVDFRYLTPGIYTYKVTASNAEKTVVLIEKTFAILSTEQTINAGTYNIVTSYNSTYFMGTSNGTDAETVHLYIDDTNTGYENLKWNITYMGSGYYTIKHCLSGYYLDVEGASSAEGTRVLQCSYHGADNQRWQILPAGGGTYCLVPKCAVDKCAGVSDDGHTIAIYTDNLSETQRFYLTKADERVVQITSTTFPDSIFRNYISTEVDTDKDGWLSKNEINSCYSVSVQNKGINNLKGIEYLTEVQCLYCQGNNIESLDVGKNKKLFIFNCSNNKLKSLDLSQNTNLGVFTCSQNNLVCLDISSTKITASSGNLNAGTVSDGTENKFNIGMVGDNYSLSNLTQYGFNPAKASNWKGATYNSSTKTLTNFTSETISYSYDCGNSITATFYLTVIPDPKVVQITSTAFPDSIFQKYISDSVDTNKDGWLSESEIKSCYRVSVKDSEIGSLKGIEYLTSIQWLFCQGNNLTGIDLSKNTKLAQLNCSGNKLTALDLSNNPEIYLLTCNDNNFNIGTVTSSYSLSNLTQYGFDASKVKTGSWSGATYNSSTKTLTNFTSTTVSYEYDCGNEKTATFYLVADSIPTTPSNDGDLNGDGKVNNRDLMTLRIILSQSNPAYNAAADINGDGKVNNRDLMLLRIKLSQG